MRTRNGLNCLSRDLKRRDSLLPRHGRKRIQEGLKRVAGFEVIEQRAHENACADEDRCAAHDLGVGMNDTSLFVTRLRT